MLTRFGKTARSVRLGILVRSAMLASLAGLMR